MDECTDFLNSLHQKGVKLWLDNGRVHYKAKKGTMTAKDVATLQARKDDIVSVLRQWKNFTVDPFSIGKQESASLAPLTVQQELVWSALQRGALSYLDPFALRVSGPLKVECLKRSFEEIIQRHDSLRTRIVLVDGIPKQKVDKSCHYHLEIMDLSDVSEVDVSARVQDVVEDVLNQGCDIANEPLLEVRLIKLGERNHLLVWSIHHIVTDGLSNILIFRELWLLYSELSQGRPSPLQSIPMQYADYAIWQEETQRSWLQKHEPYWKERLTGATGIRWPIHGDQSAMKPRAHSAHISFCRELSGELRALAAIAGSTLGMVVLTVYAIVVSQWCNQKDFVVTTSASGRDRSELETMAGYCAHGLYLRIQLIDSETFIDLLNEISKEFYRGLLHQGFRMASKKSIDFFAGTLFQWLPWRTNDCTGMPGPKESAKLDVVVEPYPVKFSLKRNGPFSDYNALTAFWDTDEGIVGNIYCAASYFSETEFASFSQSFRLTAERFVQNPYARIAL